MSEFLAVDYNFMSEFSPTNGHAALAQPLAQLLHVVPRGILHYINHRRGNRNRDERKRDLDNRDVRKREREHREVGEQVATAHTPTGDLGDGERV